LLSNIDEGMNPTTLQSYILPLLLNGSDVMCWAQASSETSASFLIHILNKSLDAGLSSPPSSARSDPVRDGKAYSTIMVIAPSSSLFQIHNEAVRFTMGTWMRVCVVSGGDILDEQLLQLQEGCDVLTVTPSRAVHLLDLGRISLANIRFLCMAEADKILPQGFEPRITRLVNGGYLSIFRSSANSMQKSIHASLLNKDHMIH
jgi:ATP-dependent RNA helicase DDX3X